MNWPTIITAVIVAAVILGILLMEIRNKKKGKSACSCGCDCGCCGCGCRTSCHPEP